jgi:uncharacterized membrane protein YqjE
VDTESSPSGLLSQIKAMAGTALASVQNRGELFLLELEEEKTNLIELFIWALVSGLMGLMFLGLFTLLVVLLFPDDMRIYAVAGFCALYLAGAVFAGLNLKTLLKRSAPPFAGTINEIKKDRACFDSSK